MLSCTLTCRDDLPSCSWHHIMIAQGSKLRHMLSWTSLGSKSTHETPGHNGRLIVQIFSHESPGFLLLPAQQGPCPSNSTAKPRLIELNSKEMKGEHWWRIQATRFTLSLYWLWIRSLSTTSRRYLISESHSEVPLYGCEGHVLEPVYVSHMNMCFCIWGWCFTFRCKHSYIILNK